MNTLVKLVLWMSRLMADGGDGGGGAGGTGAVDPAAARQFVAGFVHDPKMLEGMKDDQVMAYHGQVNKTLGEHVSKALTKANDSRDWRKEVAGDNPDALKTLERFASPKALYESYDQFRTRLSKGELKAVTAFPDKGTAEQQQAWRAENGIPESPEKYEWKLPKGMVIGEQDKPVLESLAKHAHAKNVPAAYANEVVSWYMEERVALQETKRAEFEKQKTETAAALGQEWGADYKPNLNKIDGLLDSTIPADQGELKTLIKNAIATNPHFARHYAQIALEMNPTGTNTGIDRGANEGNLVDSIKEIEKVIRSDRAKYDKDDGMRKRYRDLLSGYQRMTGKEWGQQS